MAWLPFRYERLIGQFHRLARCEHGIYEHERATVEVGRGDVFNAYIHFAALFVAIVAIGRYEGVVGMVEDIEETRVEGQSGTKDGGDDDAVVLGRGCGRAERCLYEFSAVVERLRDFEGHGLAYSLEVATEALAVALDNDVTQLGYVTVDDSVLFGKVDYFHYNIGKSLTC